MDIYKPIAHIRECMFWNVVKGFGIGGNHMTIKEAKELAHASFTEAYAHEKEAEETNIGATANYIMLYINNILLPHGFACGIKWKKERSDFVLELYKKECNIGAVYCKEVSK